MITDPTNIREALGWTPDRIAALKAATTWPAKVDLLLDLLQPLTLLDKRLWTLEENDMAFTAWQSEQDRSGLDISPSLVVPAGKTQIIWRLDCVGFTNESQIVVAASEVSHNGGVNFSASGGGNFRGGELDLGKNGLPGTRTWSSILDPDNYPTHVRVRLEVPGVMHCGVSYEFIPSV